ncbi:hypothetical protein [Aestuariicoccus sp. MJ-SS9]|uniref:hypothetical protein n=1 Tax=Aestuariicoccus sp. MJ-SS9 TaxID=3079855 RepID=UPI00290B5E05|nr:hypothetical protein [Aestuariicoccus sp. MJ-SS9]MDU8909987.1 hypothetical protein [Aestuariicoccus sp. MJ-SS9]
MPFVFRLGRSAVSVIRPPKLQLTETVLQLPLTLPVAILSFLFRPRPFIYDRINPPDSGSNYPPTALMLIVCCLLNALYLQHGLGFRVIVKGDPNFTIPYVGQFAIDDPETAALLNSIGGMIVFFGIALIVLTLFSGPSLPPGKIASLSRLAAGWASMMVVLAPIFGTLEKVTLPFARSLEGGAFMAAAIVKSRV